jgi:hypothetical protein
MTESTPGRPIVGHVRVEARFVAAGRRGCGIPDTSPVFRQGDTVIVGIR